MSLTFLLALLAASDPSGGTAAAGPVEEKQVCKREKRPNSRFESRVCRTAAQWAEMTANHQRDAREMIDRPMLNRPDNN